MPERLPVLGRVGSACQVPVDVLEGGLDPIQQISQLLERLPGQQDVVGSETVGFGESTCLVRTLAMTPPAEARRPPRTPAGSERHPTPGAATIRHRYETSGRPFR